jgi:hypothetical protein
MSDEPKKGTRAGLLWALIAVLLLVYPLSLGPALWLGRVSNTGIAGENSAYAPIWWLYAQSRPARAAIDWYTRFFRR